MKFLRVAVILLSLLNINSVRGSANAATAPTPDKETIKIGHARFTVLAREAIRMEYSPTSNFVDEPSLFASKRTPKLSPEEKASLIIAVNGNVLTIKTGKILLTYTDDGVPFHSGNPSAVITDSKHRFTQNWTFGQKNTDNLGGTLRSLDLVAGAVPLDEGLISKEGWHYIEDSGRDLVSTTSDEDFENAWVKARSPNTDTIDGFLFGYGHDYHSALRALARVSGEIPIPRRYTLGAWYSRWWPYTSDDYRTIVKEFHDHDFPLDTLVMDMDWHQPPDYTGLTWNRTLLPDAEALLKDFHAAGLHITLNDHPQNGVQPSETTYSDFMQAMGQDPSQNTIIPYDAGNQHYIETLLGMTHTPLEKEGVDFWWLDWDGDSHFPFNTLDWMNELYFRHSMKSIPELNLRGQSFSRWAGWGDQRHPIHFSGDTKILWSTLAFEIPFTSTAANSGCFYWSNDIGGFNDDTDPWNAILQIRQGELIARWTQFGAVSPVLRLHSANHAWLDKRPWTYGSDIEESMKISFHLRAEIFPYIYSSAWSAHHDANPLVKPLYYEYPELSEAYQNPQEYFFGDGLLTAPVVQKGSDSNYSAAQTVWFPPGHRWFGWFDGKEHASNQSETVVNGLNSFPLFARGGFPILMQPYAERMAGANPEKIIVRIFPGNEGDHFKTSLYEDDGETRGYLSGDYSLTQIETHQVGQTLEVSFSPNSDIAPTYSPQSRTYEVQLMASGALKSATVDGTPAAVYYDSKYHINYVTVPGRQAKLSVAF